MSLIESGPDDAPQGRLRKVARWAGIGVAAGLLIGGMYAACVPGQQAGSRPHDEGTASVPPTAGPQAVPDGDPLMTARRWLEASRTVSFTDPRPVTWTDRVAPVLTGAAAQENTATAQNTATGAGWEQLVADRCSTAVSDVDAVIPPEAPRTEQQVYVQVIGTVRTGCEQSDGLNIPAERAAATLAVTLEPDGLWRVSDRLY
ncbi:hypothetical protein [Pseudonocardia parietis]|uniref:Mce-associated membrane protein n=1 Tax=Pseudonocardia parietis TaxID=570936 RepID=A0ABS4W6Z2_9PSEU|nr:hypothetical protein [Pseudonocardia parietis]MBP2371394.1 hypothetical protein [Pseudonocardia parietis]